MSYQQAEQFLQELSSDHEATTHADEVYLSEVAAVAAAQGYDLTAAEIRGAMRSIAGLGGEVEGFMSFSTGTNSGDPEPAADGGADVSITGSTISGNTATAPPSAGTATLIGRFTPLGFMR